MEVHKLVPGGRTEALSAPRCMPALRQRSLYAPPRRTTARARAGYMAG